MATHIMPEKMGSTVIEHPGRVQSSLSYQHQSNFTEVNKVSENGE